jgi:hypothetical protein
LTPHRKRLGKAVARSSHQAIAEECMRSEKSCKHAISILGSMVQKEVKSVASNNADPILHFKSKDCITDFEWAKVHKEMAVHAPILCKILSAATKTRSK